MSAQRNTNPEVIMNSTVTAAAAAAKRAEEDAIWAAEGKRVARRVMAEQVAAMDDHIIDALRTSAHNDRSNLVNLYLGADRKERIEEVDMILSVIEEEQAKRWGLASSADILASFPAVEVQDSAHLAYLLDVDEDEQAPEAEQAPEPTVEIAKVSRCAVNGSGWAVRSRITKGGYIEVFQSALWVERTKGTELFRMV
jgi:hypothetical protein